MKDPLCSLCSSTCATLFCVCTSLGPVLLCDSHASEHLFQDRTRIHQFLPLTALTSQLTYDKLQRRQESITLGKLQLLKNLSRLDTCVEELTAKVQRLMNALSEYWTAKSKELQSLRSEYVAVFEAAVEEAERTIYEESPVLSCAMTKSLREFEKDSEALRLFEYSIESSFPCSLDSLLIVRNTMGEEHAFLPLLSQQGISLYDLKEGKLGSEATHPLVPCSQETTLCLLTSHSLMSISGHAVSCLDILTSKCSYKQATIRPRRASGAIRYAHFVYIFGGFGEKSVEKFDLARNSWTKLEDMSRTKSRFTPAVYLQEAYLVDCADVQTPARNCSLCQEVNSHSQGFGERGRGFSCQRGGRSGFGMNFMGGRGSFERGFGGGSRMGNSGQSLLPLRLL